MFHKLIASVFSLFISAGVVNATSFERVTSEQLVQKANLIFQGQVTRVEYRLSEGDRAGYVQLPHTFVEFRIERIFKGNAASGSRITLRFQGGPNGKGKILMIPGIPFFDVGDRDILFVEGNGNRWCPLIGWDQGRFRVIQDEIFTDSSQEVWIDKEDRIFFGSVRALDEVLKNKIGDSQMDFETVGVHQKSQPKQAARMRLRDFQQFLGRMIQKMTPTQNAVTLESSASVQEKFYVPEALPAAPPKEK